MAKSDIKLTTSRSWQDSYAAAIRWTKSKEPLQTARNRKAWLQTGSHAGPIQSDSCRGRTSLEESIVESAKRSTGAGNRAMTWMQSDSGPSNTRQYAVKPAKRLRYQAEL